LSSRRHKPVEIFVDRSLGRRIGDHLIAAGAIVHLHDDHFDQGVDDEIWLTEVGELGWIVLTKDKAIRYRAIEREALLNAGIRAFFFMSGNVPFEQMAEIVAGALPRIQRFVEKHKPPFIAGIYKDGTIKLLVPDSV
jgi:predicted nuclease of predicted toxin-antitoxin system